MLLYAISFTSYKHFIFSRTSTPVLRSVMRRFNWLTNDEAHMYKVGLGTAAIFFGLHINSS